MTNEIIQAIREEIARLQPNAPKPGNMKSVDAKVAMQVHARLNKLLSFLSDLEKSLPAKVPDGGGLEKEIVRFIGKEYSIGYDEVLYNDNNECFNTSDFENSARYFYDLGCRRTAEKYDEIEYNRQRAEESKKPMNPVERIGSYNIVPYIDDKIAELQDMWREEKVSFDWDDLKDMIEDVARHFAEWGAEHAKK